MTIRVSSRFIRLSGRIGLVGLSTLVFPGCGAGDGLAEGVGSETAGSETAGTDTVGDGDGDSDSDSTGDGDGAPGCGAAGCACSGDSCDAGLICVAGTCEATVCGDGVVEGAEQCDEGEANNVDGEGCNSDCTVTGVNRLVTGHHHTCAVIDGGRLRCWGRGEFGQLGYGNVETIGDDEFPRDAGDVGLPGPVAKISLGGQHSCAILEDGGLRCWGLNERGQLGYGNFNNLGDDESLVALPPVSVPPVAQIELGSRHTCARGGVGQVRCWGANEHGQLGYATTHAFEPVLEMVFAGGPVAVGGLVGRLSLGWDHACVGFVAGGLRCWGRNDSGQLGYGNLEPIGDNEHPQSAPLVDLLPPTLPPNSEIVTVALGGAHSCVLLSGGHLMCWGANGSGQLGAGNLNTIGDDELPSSGAPVMLGGPAAAVVTGANHTCALLTDATVRCWGDNSVGQLGYGHIDNIGDDELPDSAGPVELGGPVQQLTAGANHTCALLVDRSVRCWGQNIFSQLGLGNSVTVGDNEVPADVMPVPVL